jgi:D-alanine---D-serine ligase
MDKDRAHKLAESAGVKAPKSFVFENKTDIEIIAIQAGEIGYPLFVKPVRAGSSFGITKAACKDELPAAVKSAFEHDDRVIIEECIAGVEIGCAIIGSGELTVGELDEIELSDGFFDYKQKYTLENTRIHVPARIGSKKSCEIKETAKTIYKSLGCACFARVDRFLTPKGEIIFNEVNTVPGFTVHSRFPNMLKAAGFSFKQVIGKVIELAVADENR